MPEFTATITLTFGINAKDDEDANIKLEFVSGLVQGYLARPEFAIELRPEYTSDLEIETTFIS